jgi:hypothetical protein
MCKYCEDGLCAVLGYLNCWFVCLFAFVCVCMCMYVCMYVCVYACIYVCECEYVCTVVPPYPLIHSRFTATRKIIGKLKK